MNELSGRGKLNMAVTNNQAAHFSVSLPSSTVDGMIDRWLKNDFLAFGEPSILYTLLQQLGTTSLSRGDIVELTGYTFTFAPIYYIWNGKELLPFSTMHGIETDEIPGEFQVITEFPVHYWDSLPNFYLKLNTVPFNPTPHIQAIEDNIRSTIDRNGRVGYETYFDYNGTRYSIDLPSVDAVEVLQGKEGYSYAFSPQPDFEFSNISKANNVLYLRTWYNS